MYEVIAVTGGVTAAALFVVSLVLAVVAKITDRPGVRRQGI